MDTGTKDQWPSPLKSQARKANISFNAGVGFNYFQNDKCSLFVQPYSQLAVLGKTVDTSIQRYFLSLGIVAGMKLL